MGPGPHSTRRRLLQATAAAGTWLARPAWAEPAAVDWATLGQDVKSEMAWAWRGYAEHAFGHDQVKPASGGFEDFFIPGHSLGLSIVEALDTLWVMGLDAEFQQGVDWTVSNLNFDIDADIQLFESSIRLVGGLLSAHHACGDRRLLDLAHDLAQRLTPAFTRSP